MRKNTLTIKEMATEVDKVILEMGLSSDILGLKTNQDKVLYFRNYLDIQNCLNGIVELPNHYYIRLANLLCNTKERVNLFHEKFYDADENVTEQFRKFRRYLLDNRSEQDKQNFLKLIQEQIVNEDWDNLYYNLKQMFLEPFDEWIFDSIKEMIKNGIDSIDINEWFQRRKNIKSIICFRIEDIKVLNN